MYLGLHLLKHRALTETVTGVTRSASGEEEETWTAQDSELPCLLREARAPVDVPMWQESSVTHIIDLNFEERFLSGVWRFTIDEREYRVIEPKDAGKRGVFLKLKVRRVQ